ncbi:unnamed protein product [Calypogeia fissa]
MANTLNELSFDSEESKERYEKVEKYVDELVADMGKQMTRADKLLDRMDRWLAASPEERRRRRRIQSDTTVIGPKVLIDVATGKTQEKQHMEEPTTTTGG